MRRHGTIATQRQAARHVTQTANKAIGNLKKRGSDAVICGMVLCLIGPVVFAQNKAVPPSTVPSTMEHHGSPVSTKSSRVVPKIDLNSFKRNGSDIPTTELAKIAQQKFSEVSANSRSAKDAQIYRTISPSVVLIVTKTGFGSGSLVSSYGDVLTNFHVVNGYSKVAVVFKPTVEGQQATRDDIRVGRVIKYDKVADLALVKVSEVLKGRSAIRLGDSSEISIGVDVHAIGHPTGEGWTYTTGVISQYRMGYEWQAGNDLIKHKANVIQTQTPINPGNSGGPLLGDSGNLIGVNSFKATGSEGLNFAVSVARRPRADLKPHY